MKAQQEFYSSFEFIPDAVFLIDYQELRFIYVNRAAIQLTGYTRQELLEMGPHDIDVEADKAAVETFYREVLNVEEIFPLSTVYMRHKSGEAIAAETQHGMFHSGNRIIVVSILRDSTKRLQTELQLSELLKERTETLIQTNRNLQIMNRVMGWSIDGVTITDPDGTILQVNQAFCDVTGYTEEEVIGKNPRILHSGHHNDEFYEEMWRSLIEKGSWYGEIWNRRKNGEAYPESLSINAIYDLNGIITNYIAIFHDLSEIKKKEEEALYSHLIDPLTGVHSRRAFIEQIKSAITNSSLEGQGIVVSILHIEDLRKINEVQGHVVGDTFLQNLATQLREQFEEDSTIARLDGSEFGMLTRAVKTDSDYIDLRKRFAALVEPDLYMELSPFRILMNVGTARFPEDASDVSSLLRNADLALKEARKRPRGEEYIHAEFYTHALNRELQARIRLEESLIKALEESRIVPYYQPRVHLGSQRIVGAEALARWIDSDGTMIPPGNFIPFAEESGLILGIGRLMRERIVDEFLQVASECTQALTISFNISARELEDQDFLHHMLDLKNRVVSLPIRLEIELTESNLMRKTEQKIDLLQDLKRAGYTLAIDDFGTGYSSLTYLKDLPVHILKIDQSFVRNIERDEGDQAIVNAVMAMGRSFGLETVAEGIETIGQQDYLIDCGSTEGQGFLYGKPMPFREFRRLIHESQL